MGKKGRKVRHEKIMRTKRARKEAMKALYESRKNSGANKKSKRFLKKSKGSSFGKFAPELMKVPVLIKGVITLALRRVHGGPACKNVGCKRCSSIFHVPVAQMDRALAS